MSSVKPRLWWASLFAVSACSADWRSIGQRGGSNAIERESIRQPRHHDRSNHQDRHDADDSAGSQTSSS